MYEYFVSVFADPLDFNVDDASHQKSCQNRSRRGRTRNSNDRSLNSNSSSSHHYDYFNQGFNPPFRHNVSNYAAYEQSFYHENDGARQVGRGRGRGRRDGNRNVNGNFGSSRQRPGGEFGRYTGNNQGKWAPHTELPRRDGPNSPNWRRNEENNLEQMSEEQDAEAKTSRMFSLDHRRQHHYEKENNAREGVPKSGDAKEDTQRVQSGKTGPYFQSGAKRRQGPIKPPKAPGTGAESVSREQTELSQSRASVGGTLEAGQSSGRHTGRRRTNQQNHRPGQRKWDKMPESKETQTGEIKPL